MEIDNVTQKLHPGYYYTSGNEISSEASCESLNLTI